MNHQQFFLDVVQMREAQKQYGQLTGRFRERIRTEDIEEAAKALKLAKDSERLVDMAIEKRLLGKPVEVLPFPDG